MPRINLDMDVLRTLVAAHRVGGFARAAEEVGRSQAAVSQQLRKIEDRLGRRLFRRQGRGLVPTDAGELLLAYAARILALNDEAVNRLAAASDDAPVRFGLPADFAGSWLPALLARFRDSHPALRIEAAAERNTMLADRLAKGHIDLALLVGIEAAAGAETLTTLPMVWVGSPAHGWDGRQPLPLAMFDGPCVFRNAAIAALDAAGIGWRIACTSSTLPGLWAAVDAGLGVTVRIAAGLPANLLPLTVGLPDLPHVALSLDSGGRPLSMATEHLRAAMIATAPFGARTAPYFMAAAG